MDGFPIYDGAIRLFIGIPAIASNGKGLGIGSETDAFIGNRPRKNKTENSMSDL